MDGEGRGSVQRLGPRFSQEAYMTLLREQFLHGVRQDCQPQFRLQQDHSPVDMARRVRSMLEAEDDVELVPWVPRGADVSPIENVWGRMVDILTPVLRSSRISADELWEAVQDAWTRLTADYGRRLVDSVTRRLQAVTDTDGAGAGTDVA